jgi:hypothetical protein
VIVNFEIIEFMIDRFDKPPQEVLAQFQQLKKALIDTSSIIYAGKTGFFDILKAQLELITIPEVGAEAGSDADGIQTINCKAAAETVDEKFVQCALLNDLPVISEDKKILTLVKKTHLPYFNVLMMLNFLSYIDAIDRGRYTAYLRVLQKFAWYSPKIWAYGETVHRTIEREGL